MKKQKYEPDDGPLTRAQLAHVKKIAKAKPSKGRLVSSRSLLKESESQAVGAQAFPTAGLAKYIADLARQHGVRYVKTLEDAVAEAITRLADDEVITDDTENLIVALNRAHVIDAVTMITLLGNYLDEKFNVGSVVSQELAGLLAELPDGFEITDEMRAWMDMPEVGKEVWWKGDDKKIRQARSRYLKRR